MGKELIAQAFAFGGALNEARDIHELDGGWNGLLALGEFSELVQRSSGTPTTPTEGSMVQKG